MKYRYKLFFLFSLAILTWVFKENVLQTVDPFAFESFQKDSESLIIGRLIKSKKDGIFSHSAFLGWTHPDDAVFILNGSPPIGRFNGWGYNLDGYPDKFSYQYETYFTNSRFEVYEGYYSQIGGQALVYGLVDKVLNVPGRVLTNILYLLNSFFTAFVLSLILWWGANRFGLFAGIFTLAFLLLSQWPILYARNLLYVTGLFYLPFIILVLYIHKSACEHFYKHSIALILIFSTILLKCLLAGFDFIAPTLVMSILPLFFYGIERDWRISNLIFRIVTASLLAVAAVAIGLLILSIQLTALKGSWKEAIEYITWTSQRRTYGNTEALLEIYRQTQNTSLRTIYYEYINRYAIDLSHLQMNLIPLSGVRIKFSAFFSVFLLASLIAILIRKKDKRKLYALLVSLWLSLVGPFSWFVIFKNHTLTHVHMNLILWYLPFMLLGCLFTGYLVSLIGITKIKWRYPSFLET